MENNYGKFRKAAFGGFNREDVINYIEKMKNEFYDYQKEVEQTVAQLNAKIRELESTCQTMAETAHEPLTEEVNESADPVTDINEATQKLRMVADELCKSLCSFMHRVSENAVSVVIEKEEPAEEIVAEDEETSEDITEECAEEISEDKVSLILKATSSFCCEKVAENSGNTEDTIAEKRNILDILGGAAFVK